MKPEQREVCRCIAADLEHGGRSPEPKGAAADHGDAGNGVSPQPRGHLGFSLLQLISDFVWCF